MLLLWTWIGSGLKNNYWSFKYFEMKKWLFSLVFVSLHLMVFAQSKAEKQVEEAVNVYARAMIDANIPVLSKITDRNLTYGHSSATVENKEEFLKKIETGQSDFVTIDITDQKIFMHKKTAIVRHHIECITNDNNKPGTVSLDVMTVWQKKSGNWIMIARQAVKPKI